MRNRLSQCAARVHAERLANRKKRFPNGRRLIYLPPFSGLHEGCARPLRETPEKAVWSNRIKLLKKVGGVVNGSGAQWIVR